MMGDCQARLRHYGVGGLTQSEDSGYWEPCLSDGDPYMAPSLEIVTTDYRQHIPPLNTPLQNLWMANMFQVYPHDRGQNYSFELVERLLQMLQD